MSRGSERRGERQLRLRLRTPRVGLWLDTTALTLSQVVDALVERLDEVMVR